MKGEHSTWAPQLRRDLVHRTIELGNGELGNGELGNGELGNGELGNGWMEVVHDPVASSYFHLSGPEFELLKLADGNRSIKQICEAFNLSGRHRSNLIQHEMATAFFRDAADNQLLIAESLPGDEHPVGRQATGMAIQRGLLSLLTIKLPGFSPDRHLEKLLPFLGWVSHPSLTKWLPFAVSAALLCLMTRWDQWSEDISRISSQLASEPFLGTMLIVMAAIAFAKIIHELAHAMTCKQLGANCREMGVMLLCGVPCLYVDITDSWLLRRSVDRIRVAAAGILAEWWLATLATFIWLSTSPGILHDCSTLIMLACSVSTLLINGNPLLRYDGYYILSDWVGIANLSSKSRSTIHRFFAGDRQVSPFLLAYGLASRIYRTVLLIGLFSLAIGFFDDWGLAWIITGLTAVGVASWALRQKAMQGAPRAALRFGIPFTLAFAVTLCIPLPNWITSPSVIEPADQEDLYVTHAGYLSGPIGYGHVQHPEERVVARITFPDLDRSLAERKTKQKMLETQISSMRMSRDQDRPNRTSIKEIEKMLDQVTQQIASLERQIQLGVFRSPQASVLYRMPIHDASPRIDASRGFESGQYLPIGTRIGRLGHPHDRVAIAHVRSEHARSLRVGQRAKLLIPDHDGDRIEGVIADITAENDMQSEWKYRVEIELALPRTTKLIPGRNARASIRLPSESLFNKLLRFFRSQFT